MKSVEEMGFGAAEIRELVETSEGLGLEPEEAKLVADNMLKEWQEKQDIVLEKRVESPPRMIVIKDKSLMKQISNAEGSLVIGWYRPGTKVWDFFVKKRWKDGGIEKAIHVTGCLGRSRLLNGWYYLLNGVWLQDLNEWMKQAVIYTSIGL